MHTSTEVTMTDPRVLSIPITEVGEPLWDIRDRPEFAFDDTYSKPGVGSLARVDLIYRLLLASYVLPNGIRFLIREAYRPITEQQRLFDQYVTKIRQRQPDLTEDAIYQEAAKFVSPPAHVPPHSTGGAVDLTLIDRAGEVVDMGVKYDERPHIRAASRHMFAEEISEEGKWHRALLRQVMEIAGLVNYPQEWWHWSVGDRYWAYAQKSPRAWYNTQ